MRILEEKEKNSLINKVGIMEAPEMNPKEYKTTVKKV